MPSHACSFENATSQHSTGVLHFLKVAMCSAKSPCAHASKSPGQRRTSPTRGDAGTRAASGTRTRTRTRTPLPRALRPHATRDPARTRTPTRTCSASTPIRTGIAWGLDVCNFALKVDVFRPHAHGHLHSNSKSFGMNDCVLLAGIEPALTIRSDSSYELWSLRSTPSAYHSSI